MDTKNFTKEECWESVQRKTFDTIYGGTVYSIKIGHNIFDICHTGMASNPTSESLQELRESLANISLIEKAPALFRLLNKCLESYECFMKVEDILEIKKVLNSIK